MRKPCSLFSSAAISNPAYWLVIYFIGYWVMRKAMSFHNRFWTLADLGDESNDPNDGDAHSTQRAGWSKTLLRPAFWVAMLIYHEFDASAHLLWIRYMVMMHHLTWHEGGAAVLIPPRELDGARPCSVQLSGWMRAWWRWWSWVWFISTFAVNKIYAHDAPFELTSNLGCNAHLSWVRCISSLLPFAGGLWWWCNWLVAAEWVTVASMSQSTFKHTSAAAIFFPSAWRFIWVLCQTLPRASQPVGWLRGSVKGLMQAWEASACQRHSCWMHECGWDSSTFMRRPLDGTWRHERCQWKSSCWTLRLRSYLW